MKKDILEELKPYTIAATIINIIVLLFVLALPLEASQEDVAIVIAAEACGEGYDGMYAVANVIANRSRQWKKVPTKIVSAKNQFYGYTASNRHRLYSQCKKDADYLAENLMNLEDVTKGAVFFRQPSEPIYSWHGEETVRIKNHIFHKASR